MFITKNTDLNRGGLTETLVIYVISVQKSKTSFFPPSMQLDMKIHDSALPEWRTVSLCI